MNYLSLENISKSFGDKVLFENVNFQMSKGEKIALVAKNGAGKTTLIKIIAGTESAEGENPKILFRKDIRIGNLLQDPIFKDGHTIMEAVFESENPKIQATRQYDKAMLNHEDGDGMAKAMQDMDDLEAWDFKARIEEILGKLKITDLDQRVAHLSGGQKKRLALAQILIDEPEFLILDEPTNHLDLDMIEWLEEYLQSPNVTLFMVTHDRYFLERVCNNIIELDAGVIYKYKGNYSDFLTSKAIREENQAVVLDKTKKLMGKELEWMRRQPKARGTKAKSRVDSFYKIEEKASQKIAKDKIQIDMRGSRLGSKILEANYISKKYDDRVLVKDFNYKFKKGEKAGIVGPNGAGKSTLLKMLTQEIRPDSGKVVVGGTVVFGHYTQDGIQLENDKKVIDVIRDIAEYIPLEKGNKLTAESLLERFLFSRKQQQVYVSKLSGGEKRRLHLLTILMENPNFLILDEPTNDLDLITLNILEDFLMDFPGCLLVVTHDRFFMDKIVDHLFIFEGDGKIRDYNGQYSDYRALQKEEIEEERQAERDRQKQKKIAKPIIEKPKVEKPKLTYEERKEYNRLEKQISVLEEKKDKITEQFNNPNLTSEEIQKLSIELGEVKNEIEEKEMRWMELAELA
ncbi:MAG: ABC-F family ATP-binding cassette domain-containing protein [Saprospiraceae bacterium]